MHIFPCISMKFVPFKPCTLPKHVTVEILHREFPVKNLYFPCKWLQCWFLGNNLSNYVSLSHYRWFDWHMSVNVQIVNFGFWKVFVAQIIADYVYFHMTYHTFIWNHASWHRSVLNITYFQLFAWFGQTLLVRKMGKKSKLLIVDTFGSKTNFQWSGWYWTICSYQIFKCN